MFSLGNLYTPKCIIKTSMNKDCYVQIKPSTYLDKFIYCYWASPSDFNIRNWNLRPPQNEPIIPDGCVDIVFTMDKETKACFSKMYGPMDRLSIINLRYDRFQVFGITFNPGGLHLLLKSSLKELRNKTYKLEDVMYSSWKGFSSEIKRANSVMDMINTSNIYFSSLLNSLSISDSLNNILYMIYRSKGNATIKELSQGEIISERQITRIFNNWVGINPKTFSRIVRFQNIINSTIYSTNTDWLSIALDHGYYDESHFYNEFKEFSGTTPSEYSRSIQIRSDFSKTNSFYNDIL